MTKVKLFKNLETGRYDCTVDDGRKIGYLTSGESIVMYFADIDEWVPGRVEFSHDINDYVMIDNDGIKHGLNFEVVKIDY